MGAEKEYEPIHVILARMSEMIGAVGKNSRNTHQNFNFRSIDDIKNAIHPARVKCLVSYRIEELKRERSVNGKMTTTIITSRCEWIGPRGDVLSYVYSGEGTDFGDKSTMKANTMVEKTFLLQSLGLPTDEPDPDSYSYEHHSGQQQPQLTPAQECNQMAQRYAQEHGVDAAKLIADYQAQGGQPDPVAFDKFLLNYQTSK